MRFSRVPDSEDEYRVTVQTLEDLWFLSQVVSKGDEVEGHSLRRFKAGAGAEEGGRGESGEKKHVKIRLKVDSVEFAESANKLRVTGRILSGTPEEFVPVGDFHTLDVEASWPFTLFKHMGEIDRQLIAEAQKASSAAKAMVVLVDEQGASVYTVSARGLKAIFEAANPASKRDPSTFEALRNSHYKELLDALKLHDAPTIIVAGPGFQKDSFLKFAREKEPALAKRMAPAHASSTERTAVHELLRNGLLEQVLGRQKLQEEFAALDLLKKSLGRSDGMAVYGAKQAQQAVASGAAEVLLMSDEYLRKEPEASKLISQARSTGAQVLIFNSADDAGAEFSSFAVAALLRYAVPMQSS